jgi:hypothetical protein
MEAPHAMELYEGAVDALDRAGIIDRNSVGLIGFSRTFYHVLYTLTHSRYRFGAAVVADGVDFGYLGCLLYMSEAKDLCEKMNGGGPPWGNSLSGWLAASPTFNLNKIDTPLLLQAITAPLGEWEIYVGLQWLKKPVEMINFYPDGDHELVRPWERNTSQQSSVDWFCYWLKGEEDPDPDKAEQYRRWRELRSGNRTRSSHDIDCRCQPTP